ncbi:RnfABCDGE type electron transport complex subunit D [Buchnera aphidicola]|uniref:RnfABCDGE type electron transport complex subunit D n=1 Tax=Buchnera aphidicola TaxID=9 RepID=UPI003BEF48A2
MNFPNIYISYSIKKIMFLVLFACIPGICTKCYFFGVNVLLQILFSIIISLLFEIIILIIRRKNFKLYLCDYSVIVTGVLFGVSLPSFIPWWIIVIGLFFSIIIAKHLYGGIGQNIFNPAMLGYAVLLVSFPLYMTNWKESNNSFSLIENVQQSFNIIFSKNSIYTVKENSIVPIVPEFFSQATPLNDIRINSHFHYDTVLSTSMLFNKNISAQKSWTWINISFLFGGLFLLYKNVICWRIPCSFLISLGFLSTITWFFNQQLFTSPTVHLLSGGTMICAFFIATDPVTTACSNIGRIILGIIIGFLVWILRNYSVYPDSIAFSILFSNMLVPLIDYFIRLSGYGNKNI